MVPKNISKQEDLRNRIYEFFEKNKNFGKIYTVNHFKLEGVPKATKYSILNRSEHIPAERKKGSGTITKKMTQKKIKQLKKAFNHQDKMSQRQAGRKFGISQPMVAKILKKNQIKCRKKLKIPDRTEKQQI